MSPSVDKECQRRRSTCLFASIEGCMHPSDAGFDTSMGPQKLHASSISHGGWRIPRVLGPSFSLTTERGGPVASTGCSLLTFLHRRARFVGPSDLFTLEQSRTIQKCSDAAPWHH